MTFAGVNHLAVLVAAVLAWLAGAGWYMVLGKVWMAALGTTPEKMQAMKGEPSALMPFVYALAAELIMAWVLAGLIGHLGPGQVTIQERHRLRRFHLVRLRDDDHAGEQQLRATRPAAAAHRWRPLADGAVGDRCHRRRLRRLVDSQ